MIENFKSLDAIAEEAERRKAEAAARLKAEEEALLEQQKKLEDAQKAENAPICGYSHQP